MRMKRSFSDPAKPFRHAAARHRPASKRAVNVSIDAEVLKVAKEMKINLSQAVEEKLRDLTREERFRRFGEENREAIESYNRFIGKHGTWSKKYRKW